MRATIAAALVQAALGACGCVLAVACGASSSAPTDTSSVDGGSKVSPDQGDSAPATTLDASSDDGGAAPGDDGAPGSTPTPDAAVPGPNGGYPAGWLYTSGNKIMISQGSTGVPWMGRGVNTDDIFLCGYNSTLSLASPDTVVEKMVSGLIAGWKPNFLRISLAMDSNTATASWLSSPERYKTPMTNIIDAVGKNPGVYVLVTLRSDLSMILGAPGNTEPSGVPSDSTNTPDASTYPTGTDAVYVALVDSFAHSNFVMFGISNEPGGSARSDAIIGAAMNHAVGTIRAEEDKLGVPHHVVSVQGNKYASTLALYAATPSPITHDNVVYELHYYPSSTGQTPSSYAYASMLPVIVGEYGGFTSQVPQSGFYADMESMQIPSLAWDFDAFSNCSPDLINVTGDATKLTPTTWGTSVQTYLTAHAP